MKNKSPFVVVVASATSRVGQSTLAENLAVYLKGLSELSTIKEQTGTAKFTFYIPATIQDLLDHSHFQRTRSAGQE